MAGRRALVLDVVTSRPPGPPLPFEARPAQPRALQAQHERVVTAILAGNPAAAHRQTTEHLTGTEALLRVFLG